MFGVKKSLVVVRMVSACSTKRLTPGRTSRPSTRLKRLARKASQYLTATNLRCFAGILFLRRRRKLKRFVRLTVHAPNVLLMFTTKIRTEQGESEHAKRAKQLHNI